MSSHTLRLSHISSDCNVLKRNIFFEGWCTNSGFFFFLDLVQCMFYHSFFLPSLRTFLQLERCSPDTCIFTLSLTSQVSLFNSIENDHCSQTQVHSGFPFSPLWRQIPCKYTSAHLSLNCGFLRWCKQNYLRNSLQLEMN